MKSRETLIRLKKFQVDEKRRKVAQIETMIAEFDRIATELDREIKTEQERAGIHDPAHFAYPTYAKAAIGRRENLRRSADELKAQLDDAKAMLGEAFEELKKVEMLDERDHAREKAEENAREQAELDRIAALRFSPAARTPKLILNSAAPALDAVSLPAISWRRLGFAFICASSCRACERGLERGDFGLAARDRGWRRRSCPVSAKLGSLLKKLGIGLQAAGAALHLLFGGADFQPADVLRGRGRQNRREQQ